MEETKETTKKTTTKKPAAKKTTTTKKATTAKKTSTTAKKTSTPKAAATKKETVAPVKKVEKVIEEKATLNAQPQHVYAQEVDAFAAISLVLGVASLITWLYPILGVAIAIPGLSMGLVTYETRKSNYALLGIVMSLVGVLLSIVKTFSM